MSSFVCGDSLALLSSETQASSANELAAVMLRNAQTIMGGAFDEASFTLNNLRAGQHCHSHEWQSERERPWRLCSARHGVPERAKQAEFGGTANRDQSLEERGSTEFLTVDSDVKDGKDEWRRRKVLRWTKPAHMTKASPKSGGTKKR